MKFVLFAWKMIRRMHLNRLLGEDVYHVIIYLLCIGVALSMF
ncbi:hypothetical protein LEMLEM_LOCUS6962 [Lemmus lemmus]